MAGFGLLLWMVHKIGFSALKENLLRFGFARTLALILIYGAAQICFCLAWYFILIDPQKKLTFWKTFLAYAAGDALNMTIPSGNLAGEPVKVMLVRDIIPLESAITSVTIYKFSDFLSMTLFLLLGWLFHFRFFTLPLSWDIGAGIVIFGMSAVSVLLFLLQKRGFYHPTGKWLQKIGPLENWIENKLGQAHLVDKGIRDFYTGRPGNFMLSLLFNFLAWFGGVLEIALFTAMAGLPVNFPAALTIETFSLFINNVIFFVPARIGVGEGGRVLLFMTLGYSAQAGMSYGIIRRVRESAWIGLGLLILVLFKRGQAERKPAL